MKRLFAVLVLALVASLFTGVQPTNAGVPETELNLLHGYGELGGTNPVDIYVGVGSTPAAWDLLAADVEFGEYIGAGPVFPGDYNVLVCTAVGVPNNSIVTCGDNTANPVGLPAGTPITIPDVPSVTVLVALGGPDSLTPGRPLASVWEDNVDCVEPGTGRLGVNHAAITDPVTDQLPVNVAVDGDVLFTGVVWGEGGDADVTPGDHDVDVTLTADDSPVIDDTFTVFERQSTTAWVVGSTNVQLEFPIQFIVTSLDLEECPPAPTTTTTTTAPLPVTPTTRPVTSVTPAFTG